MMKNKKIKSFIAVMLAAIMIIPVTSAWTFAENEGNSATPWTVASNGTSYATLTEAYQNAGATDTITLADGVTVTEQALFNDGKAITLTSSATNPGTVTRAVDTTYLLSVGSGSVTLSNITFAGTVEKGDTAKLQKRGAAVYAYGSATLNIQDGAVIKDFYAALTTVAGAGVFINGANVKCYMTGGKIINNTEGNGQHGGGVAVQGNASFYLSGGEITGNVCGSSSAGIFFDPASAKIYVSGNAVVKDNMGFGGSTECNVPLLNRGANNKSTNLYFGQLTEGAYIGVYQRNGHVDNGYIGKAETLAIAESNLQYIHDDMAANGLRIVTDESDGYIMFKSDKPWEIESTGVRYGTLQAAYNAANKQGDTITLMDTSYPEYFTDGAWKEGATTFNGGKKITITSESKSGNVLRTSSTSNLLAINNAADDITFKDIVFGPNTKETSGSGTLFDVIAGKLTIEEGTTIRNTFAGVVIDADTGTLIVNDGTFTGNTGNYAGVIQNLDKGDVSINGGSFTGNKGSLGAIVSFTSFNMSGTPVVKDNIGTFYGNEQTMNVFVKGETKNIVLTGSLTEGADVGIYAFGTFHAVESKFAIADTSTIAEASSKYFHDDYSNSLRITTSDKHVIFEGAAIWKVSSTGKMYSTLQKAYNNSANSDTITLLDNDNTTEIVNKTYGEAVTTFAGGKEITLTSQSGTGSVLRTDKTKTLLTVKGDGEVLTIKGINIGGQTAETNTDGKNLCYGIEVFSKGKVILSENASVRGINNGGNPGAGVGISDSGVFVLDGGTIENNSGVYGGGLYITSGIFTMNKGTISGNTSSNAFGGVCILSNNNLTNVSINGGTITGNKGRLGGGIGSMGDSFSMKGSPVISNNKNNAGANANAYLFGNAKIKLSGKLNPGAEVGVTSANYHKGGGIIAINDTADSDETVVKPSVQYFSDDSATPLVIVQDINNKKNIIFSAASLTAKNIVVKLSDAKAMTAATLLTKASAKATDNNGNTQAITVDADKIAEIKGAGVGDVIDSVKLTTPYATQNIKVLVVDDKMTVASDSSGYLNGDSAIIKSSTAVTDFGSFDSVTAATSKFVATNSVEGKLVASDLTESNATINVMMKSSTDFNNLKAGKTGTYMVLYYFTTATGQSISEISQITVVSDTAVISSDKQYAIDASAYSTKLAEANALSLTDGKSAWLDNKTEPVVIKADGTQLAYTTINTNQFSALQGTTGPGEFDYTYNYKIDDDNTISKTVKITVTEDGSRTSITAMPAILTSKEAKDLNAVKVAELYDENDVKVYTNVTESTKNPVNLVGNSNLSGVMDSAKFTALNNGEEGLYEVSYRYYYNGTESGDEYKEAKTNIAVVDDDAVISTDKTTAVVGGKSISLSASDAKLRIINNKALSELCEAVGYQLTDATLVEVDNITTTTDSMSEMMEGTPGVYKVRFSVGSKGSDNYVFKDVTVAIYPDDASVTDDPDGVDKIAVWGQNAILTQSAAKALEKNGASVKDSALIKTNEVEGFTYDHSTKNYKNANIDVTGDNQGAEKIANGTVGEYEFKYTVTDTTNETVTAAVKKTIYVVSDDSVISNDNTDAITAKDKLIKLTDAKKIANNGDLIKANKVSGIKDLQKATENDITISLTKNLETVAIAENVLGEGIYNVEYTVGSAAKKVSLVVVADDMVISGNGLNGVSGNNFTIKANAAKAITKDELLQKADATGINSNGEDIVPTISQEDMDKVILAGKNSNLPITVSVVIKNGDAEKTIMVTVLPESAELGENGNIAVDAEDGTITETEGTKISSVDDIIDINNAWGMKNNNKISPEVTVTDSDGKAVTVGAGGLKPGTYSITYTVLDEENDATVSKTVSLKINADPKEDPKDDSKDNNGQISGNNGSTGSGGITTSDESNLLLWLLVSFTALAMLIVTGKISKKNEE